MFDAAKSLCFVCRVKKCKSEWRGFFQQLGKGSEGYESNCCHYHYRTLSRYSNSSFVSTEGDIDLVKSDMAREKESISADLTHLKYSLSRLINTCQRNGSGREMPQSNAFLGVTEVIRVLRRITEKWPPFQSHDLLVATETLAELSKCSNAERPDRRQWLAALERFSLEFNNRVYKYFTEESTPGSLVKSQSCENFALMNEENSFDLDDSEKPDDNDVHLMKLKEGVDFALHHLKLWSKYAKDITSYIERRTQFEIEYAQQLEKLAQSAKLALKEHIFLPFHSIYCSAVRQDIEHASTRLQSSGQLRGHVFIEPLTCQVAEVEKARKHLKDVWHRELKKTHEAINNLTRSKAMYVQRNQEYCRAKFVSQRVENGQLNGKVEKKRRTEDDALQKAIEAETTYKACVVEANLRQKALNRVKRNLLHQVRELVCQCDRIMRTLTCNYFELQLNTYSTLPDQMKSFCERSQGYEPGTQYAEYIKKLPMPDDDDVALTDQFAFEPYVAEESELQSDSGNWELHGQTFKLRRSLSEADDETNRHRYSKAAETHSFRKLRTPSKCRRCENYVYFQGVECGECALSCHKKCLEFLVIQCGHKRLRPKMTTFGIDLTQQAEETGEPIPSLVKKCVAEIERKGCFTKGLYRVSGVKSDVESLCQMFENGSELVDLTEVPINVITSVLKHYFRQLPEPLITYNLYAEFIKIAKENPTKKEEMDEDIVLDKLQNLIQRLPPIHYVTLAFLINHLKRVAKLSEYNNMPSSNLGIVFGPTLMRTRSDANSISCLMDTIHQTRVIDLLITYSASLFNLNERSPEERVQKTEKVVWQRDLSGISCTMASPDRRGSWCLTSTNERVFFLSTIKEDARYQSLQGRERKPTSSDVYARPREVKSAQRTTDDSALYEEMNQCSKLRTSLERPVKAYYAGGETLSAISLNSCHPYYNLSQVQFAGIRKPTVPLSISLTTDFLDSSKDSKYSRGNADPYEGNTNVCIV